MINGDLSRHLIDPYKIRPIHWARDVWWVHGAAPQPPAVDATSQIVRREVLGDIRNLEVAIFHECGIELPWNGRLDHRQYLIAADFNV